VGRVHVGKSNPQAIRYFVSRLKRGEWRKLSRQDRKKWLRWLIQAHADNRSLYQFVMGGGR
jgi:hypothetical protein